MTQTEVIYFQNKALNHTGFSQWGEAARTNRRHFLVTSVNCLPGKHLELLLVGMTP